MTEVWPLLLVLNAASVWALTGLGWFVQLVHTPLLRRIPRSRISRYVQAELMVSGMVTGPVLVVNLVSSLLLPVSASGAIEARLALIGVGLSLGTAAVTLLSVRPRRQELARAFAVRPFRRLLCANWIRTYLWSFHAVVVTLLLMAGLR